MNLLELQRSIQTESKRVAKTIQAKHKEYYLCYQPFFADVCFSLYDSSDIMETYKIGGAIELSVQENIPKEIAQAIHIEILEEILNSKSNL